MENYSKGKNVEESFAKESIPISDLSPNFLWMHVKGGTKIHNVLQHALNIFEKKETQQVVWSASGGGVGKAITCAEIMKREFYPLHQITKICYTKVEEYWDPKNDDLERIVVTRQIPAIHILLSVTPLNSSELGYQPPDNRNTFWKDDSGSRYVKKHVPRFDYYKSGDDGNTSTCQSPTVTSEFAAMGLKTAKRPRGNDFKNKQKKKPNQQNSARRDGISNDRVKDNK